MRMQIMNKIKAIVIAASTFVAAGGLNVAMADTPVSNPRNIKGERYENPVIHADYSDPDVVAAPDGRTFYMTASSFQCAPGLPILKSTDLVNWNLVNYALKAVPPREAYDGGPQHGKGVWAPSIRYHDGEYYIYWGDPDHGVFMVKACDPEGEWSEPVLVRAGQGIIDTTPLWDTDGRAYLVNGWAASRSGFNSILTVSEMSADGTKLIGEPRIVFDGDDGVNHTVEGPKFYKRGDWYYILAPAGGVADGWQLAMRSKNVFGPYESRKVMAQGKSNVNGPHQGGLVSTAEGEDWFLHFQDKGAYGRVVHLNPVEWKDGWPVIGNDEDGDGCGDAMERWRKPKGLTNTLKSERSVSPELFQWHANKNDFYGFPTGDGGMRIYGHRQSEGFRNMGETGNLWLEKFPAEEFTLTAKTKIVARAKSEGATSGIVVMGLGYCRLGAEKRGRGFVITEARCGDIEKGAAEEVRELAVVEPTAVTGDGNYTNYELEITFRLKVGKGAECELSYSTDGKKFTGTGRKFTARKGRWIGAKDGFYSMVPAGVRDRGFIDIIELRRD